MVRNYQQRTQRRSYSDDTFNQALEQIKSGQLSAKRCSAIYGIPRSTLRDHLKGRRGRKSSVKGGGGRSPTFSSEQEVEMAKALKIMSKNGSKCRSESK